MKNRFLKFLLVVGVLHVSLLADKIEPSKILTLENSIMSMKIIKNDLLIGTNSGEIIIIDLDTYEEKNKISTKNKQKIYSVDYSFGLKKYLIATSSSNGASELIILDNDTSKTLIGKEKNKYITKARFDKNGNIIYSLISNEIVKIDTNTKKEIYKTYISHTPFSDFTLSEDKSILASATEGGTIFVLDTKTGKIKKTLKGINVDKIHRVDIKNGKIMGVGTDRRCAIYDGDDKIRIDGTFMIFAGALSDDGSQVVFSHDENNDFGLYNISTGSLVDVFTGIQSKPNVVKFYKDKIIAIGDDENILIWSINR